MRLILISLLPLVLTCSHIKLGRRPKVDLVTLYPQKGVILQEGSSNQCFVRWKYHKQSIHVESYQCLRELAEMTYIMHHMLTVLIDEIGSPLKIKRFSTNIRNFTTIEQRMALHAFHSPDWDAKKGVPSDPKVSAEKYIQTYSNNRNTYSELKGLFADFCYNIQVDKVTGMSVFRASSLPYYPFLRPKRVKRRAQLPANYFLHFSIAPKHSYCFEEQKEYARLARERKARQIQDQKELFKKKHAAKKPYQKYFKNLDDESFKVGMPEAIFLEILRVKKIDYLVEKMPSNKGVKKKYQFCDFLKKSKCKKNPKLYTFAFFTNGRLKRLYYNPQ